MRNRFESMEPLEFGPLLLEEADTNRTSVRNQIAHLASTSGGYHKCVRHLLCNGEVVLAAQIANVIDVHGHRDPDAGLVVGAIFGETMNTWEEIQECIPDVLEVTMVGFDPRFRFAAEEWLLDKLKGRMEKEKWQHLAVCTVLNQKRHPLLNFALRNGFKLGDVTKGKHIWQWPPDNDGILPDTDE